MEPNYTVLWEPSPEDYSTTMARTHPTVSSACSDAYGILERHAQGRVTIYKHVADGAPVKYAVSTPAGTMSRYGAPGRFFDRKGILR